MKKFLLVFLTVLLFVVSGCNAKNNEGPVAERSTTVPGEATATPTATADMPVADGVVHTSKDGVWDYIRLTTRTIEIAKYRGGGSDLTIPGKIDGYTVVSIGNKAFGRCSLTSVSIPASVTNIVDNPFVDCYKLTVISVSAENPVYASISGVLFNKTEKELISYPCGLSGRTYEIPQGIKSIGSYAFSQCNNLTSVTIPDSVTSIGDYAFEDSESLTTINIPASVTHIGKNPFCYCKKLSNFGVSANHPVFEVIDHALFNKTTKELICYSGYYGNLYNLYSIENYTIPQGTRSIGDSAFYTCDSLETISIPDTVSYIGDHAFYGCRNLRYMTIPNGVTSIGNSTFSNCSDMTWVSIPDTVTSIGDDAFYWCDHLNSITIPNSVTFIGESAFQGCDRLTSITIPNSVVSIGNNPFEWCDRLTSINVRADHPVLQVVDGVLFDKVEKKLICYPYAFKDSGYIIPQGTRIIGIRAFSTCQSLDIITIPDSVVSISGSAFMDCRSLTFSVTRNSYAEQYCKDKNRDYIYTESTDWLTN